MKNVLIIGMTIFLLAGSLAADEGNQPAEKEQSAETKSLSSDNIITAFTFLLAALTVMATLFGVFIGYTGWKSGKEYEKEIAKAEKAAKRAEKAAKEAESTVRDIRSKGEKAIRDIGGDLQKLVDERRVYAASETGGLERNAKAFLQETKELYPRVKDLQTTEKLAELRAKAIKSLEKNDPERVAAYLQEMIALDQDDPVIWHALSLVLLGLERYDEALAKVSTAIKKDSKRAHAYFTRIQTRLSWHKKGGPKPSKDSVISDIRMANKYGYKSDYQDRAPLIDFFSDDEYERLTGHSKDEDKAIQDKTLVIWEKLRQILGRAIARLKEGDNERALGLIEASVVLHEANATLWLVWGLLLSELKRYEEALEKVFVAIEKDPKFGSAYFARSFVKLKWRKLGGPKPSKDEIIKDVKTAAKYERGPEKYDEADKALLTDFLGEDEYNKLEALLKEKIE